MPSINVKQVASQMLSKALPILKKDAADAESFAKTEFTKLAQTMASIGQQFAAGQINEQQAKLLLDVQKSAARNVLLMLQGLGYLAVESAINAALETVKTAVNSAVGFALIG